MATRNQYTDQEKSNALLALAKNGGNVKTTALQLGIPRKTLSNWASGQKISPLAIVKAEEEKKTLAEKYDQLAHLSIDLTIKNLTALQNIEPERSLNIAKDAVITAKLLRGEPTIISESGTPNQYKEKLEALRAVRAKRDERRLAKVG